MSKNTLRNIILSSLLMLVSASIFILMAYYVVEEGERLDSQIGILKEERSQEFLFYKLQRLAEETVEEREKLESYFLNRESDSIDFLNAVESIAPETGVELKTTGLDSMYDEVSKSAWISASFSVSGSRERVQNFIKILETFPYVSRLTEVSLASRSSTEWNADVTMQVQVLSYDE